MSVRHHESIFYSGHVIEARSVIMYDDERGFGVVGVVNSVFELEGCFVLQHHVYESGVVEFDKWGVHQSAVLRSSLNLHDSKMIELNTNFLACVTCIHVEDHGVLIM